MLASEKINLVLAFFDTRLEKSSGTTDMVNLAKRAGLRVVETRI